MKKMITILALMTISFTTQASQTQSVGPITGFGYTEYFDFIYTTANVLNAHRLDGQQLATKESINILTSICRDAGGVIIENTVKTKIIECTLESVSGSTRAMYRCQAETTADCMIK